MKRKALFLVTMLIIAIVKLNAQDNAKKSLFVISPGYVSFNNGQATGMSYSNEYVRNINKYFAYGARYMVAYGEGNVKELEYQYDVHLSTSAFDINGFFKPFKSDKHLLLLGLGISIDYTKTSYSTIADSITIDDKAYSTASTNSTISLLEPIFSMHYYYNLSKNVFLGININARDLKLYQYVVGIGAGVKF